MCLLDMHVAIPKAVRRLPINVRHAGRTCREGTALG